MRKCYHTGLLLLAFPMMLQAQTQQVSFSVQAHADDWQLFMSSNLVNDLSNNAKVVFITLTAGDAGNGAAAYGNGTIPYYLAREKGSVYGAKFAADISQTGPTPLPAPTLATIIHGSGAAQRLHNIKKYTYKNSVNYFLELPDGGGLGQGYPSTGNQSLLRLQTGAIPTLTAVDNSTSYQGWSDLTATIRAIILLEKGSDDQVWVNTASLNNADNPNDHPDHLSSSRAVQDAVDSLPWVGIAEFADYYTSTLPANLTNSRHQNAAALFALNVWGLVEHGYGTNWDETHKSWLPMDYFKIKRAPTGSANAPEAKVSPFSLTAKPENTAVPMTLTMTNPIAPTDNVRMLLSLHEAGELQSYLYDLNGQLVRRKVTPVARKGSHQLTIDGLQLQPGMYVVKHVLNNRYVETRKLVVQ